VARAERDGRCEGDPTPVGPAAGAPDGAVDPRAWLRSLVRDGLVPALRRDATVARAFFRSFNLLAGPADWMADPEVLRRVLAQQRAAPGRADPRLGPPRAELLAELGAD
jgi:hypothetical protein